MMKLGTRCEWTALLLVMVATGCSSSGKGTAPIKVPPPVKGGKGPPAPRRIDF